MAKEDAAELRATHAAAPLEVRLTLDADLVLDAPGYNVVGYLPGERAGAPIVVGAHHDGWFSAAFDNASGVAAVLALARALATAGTAREHTLCFTSRTAEEYGLTDSAYGWCTGAWAQISETHRAWAPGSPFHLNLEASGHPALRLLIETPRRAHAVGAQTGAHGRSRGLADERLVHARRRPVTGTEAWPFLISGVPSVSAYTWERSFMRTDYHTQYDTTETDRLRASRAALPLLRVPPAERRRRPRGHPRPRRAGARARRPRTSARRTRRALAQAAGRTACVRGRRAFTAARPRPLRTRRARHDDVSAHAGGARRRAPGGGARGARPGRSAHRHPPALARRPTMRSRARSPRRSSQPGRAQRERTHPRASWGATSHPPASPDLWRELASLRGERGARARDPGSSAR